jgi:short-subunit dehydrogenase
MDQTVLVTGCSSGLNVPGLGVYTASKFALESAMDALRQELAGTSVDVVMVRPGAVVTRFYDRVLEELRGLDRAAAYEDLYRTLDAVGVVRAADRASTRPSASPRPSTWPPRTTTPTQSATSAPSQPSGPSRGDS